MELRKKKTMCNKWEWGQQQTSDTATQRYTHLIGWRSNMGGCSSASSMAVMPTAQMSHSWLYPPFLSTAATSGAILHKPIKASYYKAANGWLQKYRTNCENRFIILPPATVQQDEDSGWWICGTDSTAMDTTDRKRDKVSPVQSPNEGFPLCHGHGDLSRHPEVRCQYTHAHRSITYADCYLSLIMKTLSN